jgi:hypothetical protein
VQGIPSRPNKERTEKPLFPEPPAPASHKEALEVWLRLSPEERERTVNAIGITSWLASTPKAWRSRIVELCSEQSQIPVPEMVTANPEHDLSNPDDLSIPDFLRRSEQESAPAVNLRTRRRRRLANEQATPPKSREQESADAVSAELNGALASLMR